MDYKLRTERPGDERAVECLTREAFWDVYKPGCNEHYIVHILRGSNAFIKELSIVAESDAGIVGHVLLTRAYVEGEAGERHEVLCLGPISVLPALQRQGIGKLLMREAKHKARKLGYLGILLYGNPVYYERFGFINAKAYNITTADGQNFDPFMAHELSTGSLKAVCGRFFYDDAFHANQACVEKFDALFPKKEKCFVPMP
jgi:predicted N-acetyltransferase YhbS